MALRSLLYIIQNHLKEIRKAMNDIGIKTEKGVALKDWDDLLRSLNYGLGATPNKTNNNRLPGDLNKLLDSLTDLRQAINDTGTDELERGVPLEEWAQYIRWLIENRTGCVSYTIRTGASLGDISVAGRRMDLSRYPDKLYSIYVENGWVKTGTKEFDGNFKEGWTQHVTLMQGSNVALAFDGYWERTGESLYLRTDEVPFIFWTDASGTLYQQTWGDLLSRQVLAENVTYIKAIRAWKNFEFPDQDLGVVIAYIKTDGKVYYKNWSEQSNGVFIWEEETEVVEFTGTALSLNLFITNDYRTGITVADSQGNVHWFITGRNWAGVALEKHYISVGASIDTTLHSIQYTDTFNKEYVSVGAGITAWLRYAGLINTFTLIENKELEGDWGRILEVETEHPIQGTTNADFIIVDQNSNEYSPIGVTYLEDNKYRLEFINFHNVDQQGTLKYLSVDGVNIIGNLYNEFEGMFYPINLEPILEDAPVVEVMWNE